MVSWKSKKQTTISCSSGEAKYRALATVSSELTWIHQLLQDLYITSPLFALVFCDNQVAVSIATNPTFHEHTKHIKIDCHFVQDKIVVGFLKVLPIRWNKVKKE